MNAIEAKAKQWLINYGVPAEQIIHKRNKIYDFFTPLGAFEVKLINETTFKTTIKHIGLTPRQLSHNKEVNPTYLLFSKESATPLYICKLKDIPSSIRIYTYRSGQIDRNDPKYQPTENSQRGENVMSEKVKYICDVNCPKCGSIVIIKKKIKILEPAVPAEKEEIFFAEKGVQLTLDGKEEQAQWRIMFVKKDTPSSTPQS